MENQHHCPRCGRMVEGDFCPHCDLHYTKRGVYRKKNNDLIDEEINDLFQREMEEEQYETLEEVIAEDKTVGEIVEAYSNHSLEKMLERTEENSEISIALRDVQSKDVIEDTEIAELPLPFAVKPFKKEAVDKRVPDKNVHHIEKPEMITAHRFQLKNQKWVIFGSLITILVAVVTGCGLMWYQQIKIPQDEMSSKVAKVENTIHQFYVKDNPKKGFLAKEVTTDSLVKIKQDIAIIEKKDPADAKKLYQEVKDLEKTQGLEEQVNDLYVSDKIDKNHVLNPALKDGITVDMTPLQHPKNDFEKAVNKSIIDAKAQQKKMNEAEAAMEKVYQNNQPVSGITKKDYEKAKKAVDSVKNQTFRQKYVEPLKQVKEKVNAK